MKTTIIAAAIVLLTATASYADTFGSIVFQDNFDNEPVSTFAQAYVTFEKWNVTKGTVDILTTDDAHWHAPTKGGWSLADGLIVDMGGFEAGKIETKDQVYLTAGDYELSFSASGNLRSLAPDTLRVEVGSYYSDDFVFSRDTPKTSFTVSFAVATAGLARLSFEQAGNSTENVGAHLDDIVLRNTIPEPTTSALALAALCLAMSRRRSR